MPGDGNGAWSSGALYVVLSFGAFLGLGLLKGFFLPVFFVFDLDVVEPLSTSEAAAASGSSTAPRVLVEGPDASCGGKGFMEPSVSLSPAPSTSSVRAGIVLVVAGELELGAVLLSAAVIPTTEFPGSSAPLAKVAELAWSTAVVVADGTSTDVGSKGISCCSNASMSGFRDAPDAAGVLCAIPNRISPLFSLFCTAIRRGDSLFPTCNFSQAFVIR